MNLKRFSLGGLILAVCFALISPFAVHADLYELASDTISDSDLSAVATHTITASTTVAVPATGYFEISFPAGFTGVSSSNVTCPGGGTPGGSGQEVTCTYAGGLAATSTSVVITDVTNPGTSGSYKITMFTRNGGGTELERGTMRVAILNDVVVTATVDATLTFNVGGLATSTVVNTVTTTGSSTHQAIDFGILTENSSSTIGQYIEVTTNAAYGYSVTVQQDQNLTSDAGADIDSFNNGTPATSTAAAWTNPTASLGSEETYGHFGFTSEDASVSGGDEFGAAQYKGFDGTEPIEVMYHNGPADGSTADIGYTEVAYTIEVSSIQEAGEYENNLTYVCTPTY